MHVGAKIGASRSSRLFMVHNRTFRDGRTHARTSSLPTRITPFQLCKNTEQNNRRQCIVKQNNKTTAYTGVRR